MHKQPIETSGAPVDALPHCAPGAGLAALHGVKVLDLTTSIAGPYAGMLLGDLGADVLKVERRDGGDDARAWGPPFLDGQSLWFLSVNRNKSSLAIDFVAGTGRRILEELIGTADILLVSQPAKTLAKLELDSVRVLQINPRIVYVAITGFGLTGKRADMACYDLIAEGYSGVMDLTGELEGAPQKVGAPAADMLAGMDAAFGALAALIDQKRTGKGSVVDVALVDSMIRFLTCRIVPYLGSSELPRRSGGKDSVIAIYQAFDTADLPMTLGLGTDAIWRRFWDAVGQPERGTTGDLASNQQRREQRTAIVAEIQSILVDRPRAFWLDLFSTARIPAGPINRVDEVANDRALIDRGLFYGLRSDGRVVPQVALGIRFNDAIPTPQRTPPVLGEGGRETLAAWLGYDTQRIDALEDQGIILGGRS